MRIPAASIAACFCISPCLKDKLWNIFDVFLAGSLPSCWMVKGLLRTSRTTHLTEVLNAIVELSVPNFANLLRAQLQAKPAVLTTLIRCKILKTWKSSEIENMSNC